MGAVATSERPGRGASVPTPACPARRLFEPEPGRVSLEEAILRIWGQLGEVGRATCPVCAHRIASGAPCESCGSELC